MSKYLFEISWEVANKIGGIYTVISSKAKYVKNKFGDRYFVIGPYLGAKNEQEFHFLPIPSKFENLVNNLANKGINVYYGEWLIEGRPNGFLIDFRKYLYEVNSLKYDLWIKFQIDSLRTGPDYDEPLCWSKAVSDFIEELLKDNEYKGSIFHFHEWLSGFAILFTLNLPIIKIFTTHATVLGRTLSGNNILFWDNLPNIDPEKEAYRFGVEAKHLVEKNSAKYADYVTTVSKITAEEVEYFLKRKVDFILPNGIVLTRFPTFEEISNLHRKNKSALLEFILYFFSPYYKSSCPIKNSFIFFTSGRKEIINKGFDITILALGELNKKLKKENANFNIYFFIFVPDNFIDINQEILNNLIAYRSLEEYLSNISSEINSRLLHSLIHGKDLETKEIFSSEELLEIQRILKKLKSSSRAPVSTHIFPPENEFLKLLNQAELKNNEDDVVKVIFYPIYLNPADGFLNLNYYDAINGSHLGIFPSYYEPWGYTPLETLSAGVMTITSDLTGFANYLEEKKLINPNYPGIWILKRKNRPQEDVIKDLVNYLYNIVKMDRSQRIQNKFEARMIASYFDWSKIIENYFHLYDLAWRKYES
ncbi:MAG: hypothetical protein C4278_00180 [Patescibacteria group bacterium]